MTKIVLPIVLLGSITPFYAQADSTKIENIKEVIINHTKKYKNENAFAVSKLNLKDIENPQVYKSIPKVILKDQVKLILPRLLHKLQMRYYWMLKWFLRLPKPILKVPIFLMF